MSCCGRRVSTPLTIPKSGAAASSSPRVHATLAVFRYEGEQPIIVTGRSTGAKYRFSGPGAEVAIDIRDVSSVRQVPRLRELRRV